MKQSDLYAIHEWAASVSYDCAQLALDAWTISRETSSLKWALIWARTSRINLDACERIAHSHPKFPPTNCRPQQPSGYKRRTRSIHGK